MKGILGRFIITAALAVSYLLPFETKANQGHHQSGIVGRVQVEQVGLPHFWRVRVTTENYKLIEDIQTDPDGQFVVNLKPGTYRLTPFLGEDGGAMLVGPSIQTTIEKKDFTVVEMPLVFPPM